MSSIAVMAQDSAVPVFKSGDDGYQSYRIPAIISLPDNSLLAFSEGRVNGAADFGHVNIVAKSSRDNGRTWGEFQVVAENGDLQAGNAAPVVDMTDPDYPSGWIFLFYNTGDVSEGELRQGKGNREVWYKTSVDNGKSWSDPVNITQQVKKTNWRTYANTPGHATQFQWGKYKGRIYVAANHSEGDPKEHFKDYRAHGFYTDDHGKTFHLSEVVPFPGGNENSAAELSGDRLMLNARNQSGDPRERIISISSDGGVHWDTTYADPQLPDPVNQGSILNIGDKRNKNLLAFSNDADPNNRINLTLRISLDGGKTWPAHYLVDRKGRSTAYSDIVNLNDTEIGILYERDNYSEIVFKTIQWKKWIIR